MTVLYLLIGRCVATEFDPYNLLAVKDKRCEYRGFLELSPSAKTPFIHTPGK